MPELTLTTEERAIIEARRRNAAEAEAARIAASSPFDLNDIRPGMTAEKKAAAVRELQRACAELERR